MLSSFHNQQQINLLDSIAKELEALGVTVYYAGYDIKYLEKYRETADILFLFLADYSSDMAKAMVYVKDISSDESKTLYLAGYDDEIAKAKEFEENPSC